MKKNMYIQPEVQVTEMTGMQIMDGSPFGVTSGGTTGGIEEGSGSVGGN